ncbi:MAG: hypothetical protein V1882_01465 [Candidatus Omnitrophota bacterium]
MRTVLFALSFCFIVLLVCAGSAELLFLQGKSGRNIELLKTAEKLNPLASDHAYEVYRLTGDLGALRRAMSLESTRPAYHMYYGLSLLKSKPRTRSSDKEAVTEICKAASLKPYSRQYKATCEEYKKVIPVPAGL